MTDAKTYEDRLRAARDDFDAKVAALAVEVRRDLVVPTCEKHAMAFLSGNGTYFFRREQRGVVTYYGDTLQRGVPADVRDVLATLELEVRRGQSLGHLVESVPAPSPRSNRKEK